jgi:hypothetical protein
MQRFLLLALVFALATFFGVSASPLAITNIDARDVWSPHITVPTGKTVWHVGQKVTVKWCVFMDGVQLHGPIADSARDMMLQGYR